MRVVLNPAPQHLGLAEGATLLRELLTHSSDVHRRVVRRNRVQRASPLPSPHYSPGSLRFEGSSYMFLLSASLEARHAWSVDRLGKGGASIAATSSSG